MFTSHLTDQELMEEQTAEKAFSLDMPNLKYFIMQWRK